MTDPVAAADAVVAAVDPGLSSPGVERRDVVLVTGPWLAGATSLIAALRERMPEHTFVEADELGPNHAPAAVVFVVSAIAPLTESDCALVDLATNYTDLIIGVVSKIDAHRNWRDVLAADRAQLAARAPRYQDVQWAGAAAAPDLGEPKVDELVGVLRRRLADPDVQRRNRLRAWEVRLDTAIDRYQADAAGSDRQARVTALREEPRRHPAGAAAVEVRTNHRAAQPDPAGAGPADLFRPQPLHVGACRTAGGRLEYEPAQARRIRVICAHTRGRSRRRGGRGHHQTPR